MTRRTALLLAIALVLAVSGCSVRTIGAPTGSLTLTGTFDDAQNLVAGHSVQVGDVKIGSVTDVRLVHGYRAKVTMSIKDGVRIPVGTTAEISVTSLLGENYVKLTLPPGGDMSRGPFMADHSAFARTSVQPAFEQVVGQAGTLIKAVSGNDIGTIVDAGATALGGNGQNLHSIIAKSTTLLQIFADQRRQLSDAVGQFAILSTSLAGGKDQLDQAPGQLAKTTKLLNDNKDKILSTVAALSAVARQLNDKVLTGRVDRLKELVAELNPVLAQFGDNRQALTDLLQGLVVFTRKLPLAGYDGQLLLYPILKFVLPGQPPSPPVRTAPSQQAPGFQVPGWLQNVLPNLGGNR